MIKIKKASKKDLPILTEFEIKRVTSLLKDNLEKLKQIASINEYVSTHYQEYTIIYYYLKPIGCYLIMNNELESWNIIEEYQKLKNKILKKINKELFLGKDGKK